MDIVINSSNKTDFRGWKDAINIINPVSRHANSYFNRVSEKSRLNIGEIVPELRGFVNVVPLKSARKTNIYAWDINPSGSKKYVFFLHGMAQNVASEQNLYLAAIDKGFGVFALDYRGYGLNKKAKFKENLLLKDVDCAYKYLTTKKDVNPKDITIVGHSMGGALATIFASKHPQLNSMILISPITNMFGLSSKFVHNKTLGLGVPSIVNDNIIKSGLISMLSSLRFNALSKVKNLEVPTYIVQSRNDSITPCANARLFAGRANQKGCLKDLVILNNGGHNIDRHKIDVISGFLAKLN